MRFKDYFKLSLFAFAILVLLRCSNSDDSQECNSGSAIPIEFNTCLLIEHEGLTDSDKNLIEAKIIETVIAVNKLMDIDDVLIRVVDDPSMVIPEIGIGGFNPSANEVIIAINEGFNNLSQTLNVELAPMLAHELHHAKRRRSVGYGNTLLQAAVTEGLADHFAIELMGINPPLWSIAITGSDLETWIEMASDNWNTPPYSHSNWFLGASPSIPRWLGYSMGFELVKKFLEENPDETPSSLHNEPATSFQ